MPLQSKRSLTIFSNRKYWGWMGWVGGCSVLLFCENETQLRIYFKYTTVIPTGLYEFCNLLPSLLQWFPHIDFKLKAGLLSNEWNDSLWPPHLSQTLYSYLCLLPHYSAQHLYRSCEHAFSCLFKRAALQTFDGISLPLRSRLNAFLLNHSLPASVCKNECNAKMTGLQSGKQHLSTNLTHHPLVSSIVPIYVQVKIWIAKVLSHHSSFRPQTVNLYLK